MPRKQHKYHYIYKTTCIINGKFYIGMHSTDNLEDGYVGSGKRLRRSLFKYGIENHTKEILEFLNDRETLIKREEEIVNEQLIQDSLCMNLKKGGLGGFCNEEHFNKFKLACKNNGSIHKDRCKNPDYKKLVLENWNKNRASFKEEKNGFWCKKHSEESKQKMRDSKKNKGTGENNSQFGTCWITNGLENKKIKKTNKLPDGWSYGRRIKNL